MAQNDKLARTVQSALVPAVDNLYEEFNIFYLEGRIFDLSRKHSNCKANLQEYDPAFAPITVEPHTQYGRPGVGAFKALQAIFFKLTEEGWPFPNTVSFTRREFERLRGSEGQGGYQMARSYNDLMQLQTCMIHCTRRNSETDQYEHGIFSVINKLWFSGPTDRTTKNFSKVTITLDQGIVDSMNRNHYARFNWYRMSSLIDKPIAMILYKRFFQYFAHRIDEHGNQTQASFQKDYEDICNEWLGGLKPERYKSKILSNQLGIHIEAVQRTRLCKIEVEKREKGSGFKLVFIPRKGFFEDYQRLYLDPHQRPQLPFNRSKDRIEIQEPIQLVDFFHRQFGREKHRFLDSEVEYAQTLLNRFSYPEVEKLVETASRHLKKKNVDPYSFKIVDSYVENWSAKQTKAATRQLMKNKISSCAFCDMNGFIILQDPINQMRSLAYECPHDAERIAKKEVASGLKRI